MSAEAGALDGTAAPGELSAPEHVDEQRASRIRAALSAPSWRWLTRRTHRIINQGLLVAAVAGAVSLVWLAGAFAVGRTGLLHALQQGSAPAEAFARRCRAGS